MDTTQTTATGNEMTNNNNNNHGTNREKHVRPARQTRDNWIFEEIFWERGSDVAWLLTRTEPKHEGGESHRSMRLVRIAEFLPDGTPRTNENGSIIFREHFGMYYKFDPETAQAVPDERTETRGETIARLYDQAQAYVQEKITDYKIAYLAREEEKAQNRERRILGAQNARRGTMQPRRGKTKADKTGQPRRQFIDNPPVVDSLQDDG